jgi:hypothetical protein
VFLVSLPEEIMVELESMNDQQKREVLDFARYLRMKEARELERLMDDLIDENLEALRELAK